MSKRIVRITESDLVNMVKRVISEQGGYDDPLVMSGHAGRVLGGLAKVLDTIINILEQTISAIETDIPKNQKMSAITRITDVLDSIEDHLRKINPEIMLNRDLRKSVSELKREVKKGKDKLRTLSSYNDMFYDPRMSGSLTGAGISMGDKELNDKLSEILYRISHSAEKVSFQLRDESDNMFRRLNSFN